MTLCGGHGRSAGLKSCFSKTFGLAAVFSSPGEKAIMVEEITEVPHPSITVRSLNNAYMEGDVLGERSVKTFWRRTAKGNGIYRVCDRNVTIFGLL